MDLDLILEQALAQIVADVLPQSIGYKNTVKLFEGTNELTAERIANEDENFDYWLSVNVGNFRTLNIDAQQICKVIKASRVIWASSEIYKSVLWNRRNFILGDYISFDLLPIGQSNMDIEDIMKKMKESRVAKAHNIWAKFWRRNDMWNRVCSWANKRDRDSNVFIHIVGDNREDITVRFIDPLAIFNSGGNSSKIPEGVMAPNGIGVLVQEDDIESIYGYLVQYADPQGGTSGEVEVILAEDIIYDKVTEDYDSTVGVPRMYPVLTNIRRAEKLLLNSSTLTQIQTAIALIRKHKAGMSGASIAGFTNRNATGARKDNETNRSVRTKRMAAGTILDAKEGTEYDFPAHAVRADGWMTVRKEELSAIASCGGVSVEWLLATEQKEPLNPGSPIIRGFLRDRKQFFTKLEELYWQVLKRSGVNIEGLQNDFELVITAPVIPTSKAVDQARIDDIYIKNSVKSPQQVAREHGTRYSLMRSEIIEHRKTKQEGEQFPGDAGMTQVDNNQTTDGITKADGTVKSADGDGGDNR